MLNAFRQALAVVAMSIAVGCTYTPPKAAFDSKSLSLHVVGLIPDAFPDRAVADQPRNPGLNVVNGIVVPATDNTPFRNSDRFTAALASIGYDPEVTLRRSLHTYLSQAGIQAVDADSLVRKRHMGIISEQTFEYVGQAPKADAYLNIQFAQWGFAAKMNQTVLRPYAFFGMRLDSLDGKRTYMKDSLRFNDIDFNVIKAEIIQGDQSMQFESVDELVDNPKKAAAYLDAAIDQMAREIVRRLMP